MKRTQVTALVLINWKGFFYERFEFHDRVTALEGVNGAGKTTVMIAAYVALLPDMSLLRFTNLGEHGATGGDRGIYGRLGESSRPTYTVLELRQPDGERVLAGVQLVRKSAPSVELTPFLITGLPWETKTEDALLERGELDEVPELDGLRRAVTRAGGGKLVTYEAAKDYFAELFERGITPLRLLGDEERRKFNEVLRTSMVGGISRALTGELRSFLLKEDTGLADNLKNMRASVDACRRTRIQVEDARRLEEEISAILEAGQDMFAAAVHATEARAAELVARLEEARRHRAGALEGVARLEADVVQVGAERERAEAELRRCCAALEEAQGRWEVLRRADELQQKLQVQEAEQARREPLLAAAAARRQEAEEGRTRWQTMRERAMADQEAAAQGLADARSGFDELVRKAEGHRQVTEQLDRVRVAFLGQEVLVDGLAGLRRQTSARVSKLDRDIARLDRELETAAARARDFERVKAALERVLGTPVPAADALERAKEALQGLRELAELAKQLPDLPRQRDEARARARAQGETRAKAQGLARDGEPLASAADVEGACGRAEQAKEACDGRLGQAQEKLKELREEIRAARERLAELEAAQRRFRSMRAALDELAQAWDREVRTSLDLQALHRHLEEGRLVGQRALGDAEMRLGEIQADLGRLLQGGRFENALLRARDAVDGELLAGRFEDVGVEQAGVLQARLGPLYEAILVEDARAAVARLGQLGDRERPATVWLLDGDGATRAWDGEEAEQVERDVLVREAGAHRLTRIPEQPVLGRKARERRIEELRQTERRQLEKVADLRAEQERLALGLNGAAELLPHSGVLDQGDPAGELERTRGGLWRSEEQAPRCEATLAEAREALHRAVARRRALQNLLAQAHLLDQADQAAEVERMEERLRLARLAQGDLQRTAAERTVLEKDLDVLRAPPLSRAGLAALAMSKEDAETERDRLAPVCAAIRYVEENRDALGWADAAEAVEAKRTLTPALEARVAQAKSAYEEVKQALGRAEREREQAVMDEQQERDLLNQVVLRLRSLSEELGALGVAEVSAAALRAAAETVRGLTRKQEETQAEERRLSDEGVRLTERLSRARSDEVRLAGQEAEAERTARPAQERWARLERDAQERGVLAAAQAERFRSLYAGQSNATLWTRAQSQRALLGERLQRTKDGAPLASWLERLMAESEQSSGDAYLEGWLRVRQFLLRRIPPQIAEAADPLVALGRLRDHLRQLDERLKVQEETLRGRSTDVATHIDSQVRRARQQVLRLNKDLGGVRFGSIAGVQIKVGSAERMEQVLRALREGPHQGLLFQTEVPLEDALDQIFSSVGGGKSGGHRLLDYREYLELQVQVRRQAHAEWEPANSTKMSTGEAIGVGAAVMMVVLTAWERDANLLRPKRASGTLRLLFLDEATRLSQDNLGILFELCQNLELQLLLAAPEVAQAQGNITHHLVRRVEAGREVVRVSGRRVTTRATE